MTVRKKKKIRLIKKKIQNLEWIICNGYFAKNFLRTFKKLFLLQETLLNGCLSILQVIQVRLWRESDLSFPLIVMKVYPSR